MKYLSIFLIFLSIFFSACSSKDNTLIDTKTQQQNAKEALKFASNPKFSSNFAFYKDIR